MSTAKTILRVGGVVLLALGLMFLPHQDYTFTRGDLSRFHNWADYGVFSSVGLPLVVAGLLGFGASFLLKGDLTD